MSSGGLLPSRTEIRDRLGDRCAVPLAAEMLAAGMGQVGAPAQRPLRCWLTGWLIR